jgi:hypothetical protein
LEQRQGQRQGVVEERAERDQGRHGQTVIAKR